MISSFVLFDLVVMVAAVSIAVITPRTSQYRAINLVLVGEFASSIGLAALIDSYLFEGIAPFAVKLCKDLIFCFIFYRVGGLMLSKVQKWIALYHAALILSIYFSVTALTNVYTSVMIGFCIIQLLCGIRGALHGTVCGRSFPNLRGILRHRGHI